MNLLVHDKYSLKLGRWVKMVDDAKPLLILRFPFRWIVIFLKKQIAAALYEINVTINKDEVEKLSTNMERFQLSRSRYTICRAMYLLILHGTKSELILTDFQKAYKSDINRLKNDVNLWYDRTKAMIIQLRKEKTGEKTTLIDFIISIEILLGGQIPLTISINEFGAKVRAAERKIKILEQQNEKNK